MSDKDKKQLICQRLIDDWFYQSNARRYVSDELSKHNREDMKYDLNIAAEPVLKQVSLDCHTLAEKYDFTKNSKISLSFPWDRLFEINVKMKS